MKRKFFFSLLALTLSVATWAAVGPQSIKVTFNGTTAEDWQASSGGSITSVADGVANVQMAMQYDKNNVCLNKYRADFQHQVAGTFAIDKTRDIVWAIKLTAPLPGTANSRKFEFQYKDADNADQWVNGINGPSGQIDCVDGGRIYYFNLGADGLNKLGALQDGAVSVNKVHFIFADATELTDETARYAVDWVATFSSVEDLKFYTDWKDEQTNFDEPMFEHCFRPKVDGSGNENGYPKSGISNDELEANYQAQIVAVEYFLIDYSIEDIYTLEIAHQGGGGTDPMSIWNFPHLADRTLNAGTLNGYLESIVGFAPKAAEGTANEPIATANCNSSKWTLTIPAYKLTPLAEIGTKTLVGLLITSSKDNLMIEGKSAKFASSCNTSIAHPSLTYTGSNPVVNLTQHTASATLSDAVTTANAGDVIELRSDVTISGSRLDIDKELTIQGATGAEKIICGVGSGTIMLLANGSGEHNFTLKDLVIDGQNTTRSTQTVEVAGDAVLNLDGVRFVNTAYSTITGDVKSNSNKEIFLKGNNTIPNGIYLNRDKRVNNQYATHTSENPILIYLVGDYKEDYAIVRLCNDASLYNIVSATDTHRWEIYVASAGDERELKGTKIPILTLEDNADNSTTLSTNNGKRADVSISRSITANGTDYATFCVPFAIDAETVAEQLGNPAILRYSHTEINGDEATFYFTDADAIEAGVPYLIKPEGGATLDLKFRHVTIDNTLNEATDGVYSFVPVFSQTTIADASDAAAKSVIFLSSGNQLKWAAENASLKGMRAYFRQVAATPSPIMRMRIGTHGIATDAEQTIVKKPAEGKQLINGALIIEHEGRLYNAQGQQIQ